MLQGYTYNGVTKLFPVVPGEFGSFFNSSSNPCVNAGCMAEEGRSLYSIRDYFNNAAGGKDGKHAKINNWFYWSWNSNSGDTGGLVCCLALALITLKFCRRCFA